MGVRLLPPSSNVISLGAHMSMIGKTHSPETREKIRVAGLGNTNAKGYRHSPETRENMSAAHRGKTLGKKRKFFERPSRCVQIGSTHEKGGYVDVKTENGWELEHRVVAGLVPGDKRVIHHIDGDRRNNEADNLLVLTKGEHTEIHNRERTDLDSGVTIPL